jgi:hypothetical protein
MEKGMGLLEWCARSVEGGGLMCYEPQRFLWWLRGRNQRRTRFLPRVVMEAFDSVRCELEAGRVRQSLADPVAGYPGDAVAGDASSTVGWGVVVFDTVYHGLWEEESLAAYEVDRCSTRRRSRVKYRGTAPGRWTWRSPWSAECVRCPSPPWS